MTDALTLTLPGWQGSGPGHWQSLWEAAHGYQRVEQHDWLRPLRGDWSARLEEVLLDTAAGGRGPAVLVAHSLGCMLVAAWAAHSRNTQRVKAALLVAPPDVERADLREVLPGWSTMPLQTLPFPALVLASSNDPFCDLAGAKTFAAAWGADFMDVGPCGHINADSGLGDWPEAHRHLERLQAVPGAAP
ncbi:MAG: serine hydrolase family protein [Polaromonas sp.]|nr:serine hydrolase family protein [Polaromonas sp.]